MSTRAARTLHLVLFGLGVILYVVFVVPRWWVLTGDIPRTLATAGRIAAGIPIGLAALPVMQLLQAGLRGTPRPPELALRLRAWSGVLHVVAGALILLTAIVEIWLRLQVAGPWLFAVYGAAGAIAILGCLALYLSFVAEKPPAEPKAPNAEKPKKVKKVTRVRADAKPKATKRGRATGTQAKSAKPVGKKPKRTAPAAADETVVVTETGADASAVVMASEVESVETDASDTAAVIVTDTGDDEAAAGAEAADADQPTGVLRNKRPSGKSRHRLRR